MHTAVLAVEVAGIRLVTHQPPSNLFTGVLDMILARRSALVRMCWSRTSRGFSVSSHQGISHIHGPAALWTGDIPVLHNGMIDMFKRELAGVRKLAVLIFDKTSIAVPANERAWWLRKALEDPDTLEVQVVYGPARTESILSHDLVKSLSIDRVLCSEPYSRELAEALGAQHHTSCTLPNENEVGLADSMLQSPSAHTSHMPDAVARRLVQPFRRELPFAPAPSASDLRETESVIKSLNTNHPKFPDQLLQRLPWDVQHFRDSPAGTHTPVVIGALDSEEHRTAFCNPHNAQVYDMPIYMPGEGWHVPHELSPYLPALEKIVRAEYASNPNVAACNCYITTDIGRVAPEGSVDESGL